MNLLSFLCRRKPRRSLRRPRLAPLPELRDDADGPAVNPDCDDSRQRCCGWFDSSHELQHGLSVCEHASPDALAAELPLSGWLDLHLSGWQAANRAEPAGG